MNDQPPTLMTSVQEQSIHDAINQKISEVTGGLSRLDCHADGLKGKDWTMVNESVRESQQSRPLDLLEVYCGPNSQITQQVLRLGGVAKRFTINDGDLGTTEGVQKLWLWIQLYEPRHIWLAPECKLYGKFSNLNMSRSLQDHDRVVQRRRDNRGHLTLCNEIYRHQVSLKRHVHLEQPSESCMTSQPELQELVSGTFRSCFDMCRLGKLRLPHQQKYLRKGTKVHTSSGYVHYHLHDKRCLDDHEHETIQGSVKTREGRQNVSAYAAAYTPVFGAYMARVILEECELKEDPVDIFAVSREADKPEMAPSEEPCPKRQRHGIKGPPRPADLEYDAQGYGKSPTWGQVVRRCNSVVPRVGSHPIRPGDPLFQLFQLMVPELELKLIMLCRGTERFRIPGSLAQGEEMPWRRTILVDRGTGEIIDKGPPENWKALPKLQQTRRAGSARVSITCFGVLRSSASGIQRWEPSNPESVGGEESVGSGDPRQSFGGEHASGAQGSQMESSEDQQGAEIQGWPPRVVPQSGPHFEALDNDQKADLRRLHANLGHPSPDKLSRLLQDQGASDEVIKAARDFQCDSCIENQTKPKLPSPATIHSPKDFNDCVGGDGAYWVNGRGRRFHFMHFIDEATLFHLGAPSGRAVDDQIETFENIWLHWAGPCKELYLDPAGEYLNDRWHEFLQKEGIRLNVAAGESHWQIGRVEAHGRIIKQMLTAMDAEEQISSQEDFRRCLRHVFFLPRTH